MILRARKGCYGYFRRERLRRLLVTVLLLILPCVVFVVGYLSTGTRQNICTVLAIVGCLPACRSIVGLIMVFTKDSIPEDEYQAIRDHAGGLTVIYELYLTTEKQNGFVDAYAICGNEVVGYSSDDKTDVRFIAAHTQKILRHNGCKANVKVLREFKPFLERLQSLERARATRERDAVSTSENEAAALSGDEQIRRTILAIAL